VTPTRPWRWHDIGVFLFLLVIFTAIGMSLAIFYGNLFGAKGYYVQNHHLVPCDGRNA
jgi:hypothetical protein